MSTYNEVKSDAIKLTDAEDNEVSSMGFTNDGQILTISTQGGFVHSYLARMAQIYAHYDTYITYLSSLREVTVVDVLGHDSPIHIQVSIEPSFVAIGPRHVAVGMNNRVYYYRCDGSSRDALVNEQQYLGSVSTVKLNRDFAAVLSDNKVMLHMIETNSSNSKIEQSRTFPDLSSASGGINEGSKSSSNDISITSIALTKTFFVYSTSQGCIHFFYLTEWANLDGCTYRHDDNTSIVQIFPNKEGTKVAFMDSKRRGYILNSVNHESLYVPSIPNATCQIMWDISDPNVFVAIDALEYYTYLYTELTINGPEVTQLGYMEIDNNGDFLMVPQSTKLPASCAAVLFYDGAVTCQHTGGALTSVVSCTHDMLQKSSRSGIQIDKSIFRQYLSLLRMPAAWKYACDIDEREYWLALASRAMHILDISLAKRVYRQLGDAGMVLGLSRIENIEEKTLLAGHICMLFDQYDQAQKLFLNSSYPLAALEMQRYLLHYDQALMLADTLNPEIVPELSYLYGTQLEFKGDFENALKMYEHAMHAVDSNNIPVQCDDVYKKQCNAGVARCTLRLGDLRRGIRLVNELKDVQVSKDCGLILENMKQFNDAALLYEQGEQYDKAVALYIQMKNLNKATPLMSYVKVSKMHAQYAKAKEIGGEYQVAAEAYGRADDMDNVVRIHLEHLHSIEKACAIVKKTRSSEGASMIAKHCMENGDYIHAVEFLLMANREDEAYKIAIEHNEIETFTKILGDTISNDRALKIAQHFEQVSNPAHAGEFYQICGKYSKALHLFLQCGESELNKAIDVVGKARNDTLTHELIDYLMGETDGIPKDPNYIFRLYMALGNYIQASKTAIIIARQEQELGNYKVAHDVLVETHRQLQLHQIHINQDLRNTLTLLHSYILVKKIVKKGDHLNAAKLLVRVVKNISKFPTHVSNILISAVIECQRAGLKGNSFEYATMLMRPEYRNNIDKEIKRKIEAIVRRPNKEQVPDAFTLCPFCNNDVIDIELDCTQCKNWIPYCIVTGYHIVKSDYCVCPHCRFPALFSQFLNHLETDPSTASI